MTPARELSTAVAAYLVGAAVVLLALGKTWAGGEASRGAGLPVASIDLTGSDLASACAGLGLLALAAVAGLLATRGVVRRTVGALTVVAGLAIAVLAARADGQARATVSADIPDATSITLSLQPWPWVTAAGGVAIAAAGVLALLRAGRWPSMSRRYEAPRAATATVDAGPASADELWRALDRGDDPTAEGRGPG